MGCGSSCNVLTPKGERNVLEGSLQEDIVRLNDALSSFTLATRSPSRSVTSINCSGTFRHSFHCDQMGLPAEGRMSEGSVMGMNRGIPRREESRSSSGGMTASRCSASRCSTGSATADAMFSPHPPSRTSSSLAPHPPQGAAPHPPQGPSPAAFIPGRPTHGGASRSLSLSGTMPVGLRRERREQERPSQRRPVLTLPGYRSYSQQGHSEIGSPCSELLGTPLGPNGKPATCTPSTCTVPMARWQKQTTTSITDLSISEGIVNELHEISEAPAGNVDHEYCTNAEDDTDTQPTSDSPLHLQVNFSLQSSDPPLFTCLSTSREEVKLWREKQGEQAKQLEQCKPPLVTPNEEVGDWMPFGVRPAKDKAADLPPIDTSVYVVQAPYDEPLTPLVVCPPKSPSGMMPTDLVTPAEAKDDHERDHERDHTNEEPASSLASTGTINSVATADSGMWPRTHLRSSKAHAPCAPLLSEESQLQEQCKFETAKPGGSRRQSAPMQLRMRMLVGDTPGSSPGMECEYTFDESEFRGVNGMSSEVPSNPSEIRSSECRLATEDLTSFGSRSKGASTARVEKGSVEGMLTENSESTMQSPMSEPPPMSTLQGRSRFKRLRLRPVSTQVRTGW
eukprot:Hpha_TRINITY_DN16230_c2_g2::TRINITY_DN16230_c2_g2_i1::g.11435::m.11435